MSLMLLVKLYMHGIYLIRVAANRLTTLAIGHGERDGVH